MFKVMIALLGLSAIGGTAQANHDKMLERLECRGEITRSGVLKLGITSYLREQDGDLDRDYDVVRCHQTGMSRSGSLMFSCNHPYVQQARIQSGNRGLAQFIVNYENTRRSLRGATFGCPIDGQYRHEHDADCDHGHQHESYPEKGMPDQGDVEQGPEQGPEQGGKTPMK